MRASVRERFRMTWRDGLVSIGVLTLTGVVCALLNDVSHGGDYVSMLFVLGVFMIARFTEGYLCGILSSLISVLIVNYIFTYPYFHFNFTLAGYPIAILSMLAVSITTSTLTSGAKRAEEIRIEAEKEKTRSNLLRAVSHDLRTPLTSISGSLSLLRENGEAIAPEDRAELLRVAQDEAQWLIRMVENLLIVTRIDGSSAGQVKKVPEAAEEVVSGAVMKFRKRFPDMRIEADIADDCPLIPMDAVLIEQVLQNLMENAALHGKTADRIVLTVQPGDGKALFRVHDNGVGIDPGKLPHLFDGQLQSDAEAEEDRKRNMGIGLSVCYAIIQAHDGVLRGYNDPAGGAVFEFQLSL